jgi:hypothetical protein
MISINQRLCFFLRATMDRNAAYASSECSQMQDESMNPPRGARNTEQVCANGHRNAFLLHTQFETSAGWGVPHPFVRKY